MLRGLEVVALSPLTVSVLVWPAVIEAESKEQVTPAEQARVMLSVNELGAEAETVKVVEAVPMVRTVDRGLEEREKTALPVPWRSTPWGLFAASSVTVRLPELAPLPVGVNVMLTLQLWPTLSTLGRVPHVLVWAKSPEIAMLVTVTAIWPVFVRRTVWAGLVTPTVSAGKVRLVEDGVSLPPAVTPVPVTVMTWGLPWALSVMVTWSVLAPVVVGVNVI